MTNDELNEIEVLMNDFPYIKKDLTGSVNGITPEGVWEPLKCFELFKMRRLMFLLGKQEGELKSQETNKKLYSADPQAVFDEVKKALIKGSLSHHNIIVFVKKLLENMPLTTNIALKEFKDEGNSDFKDLFSKTNLLSAENIENAFRKFVDSPGNDDGDIVSLINDLNDIAMMEVSEDYQKEILKNVVEELS